MPIPDDILLLIEKYQAGTATEEERQRLNDWYHSFDDSYTELPTSPDIGQQLLARLENNLPRVIRNAAPAKQRRLHGRWIAAAAVFLFALFTGIWMLQRKTATKDPIASATRSEAGKVVIRPGGNKALLTLANGSVIVLDSASNGILVQQGGIRVKKLDNGLLAYTNDKGQSITQNDEAFYNTITTPRGGKYQVTLSDGTMVWLNAASSIRFPVVFSGAERNVAITGEAYFEVAKDKTKPFRVKTATSEVEVLGTHFNINAYPDEPLVRTTLLEGMVKVSVSGATDKTAFLKPGQQAGITREGTIKLVANADLEEAVAWKNGRFQFKSADLASVLRQLSRWYDIDIEDHSNARVHFTGGLSREENVSKVFEQLELTGEVHIKTDGRKITVLP